MSATIFTLMERGFLKTTQLTASSHPPKHKLLYKMDMDMDTYQLLKIHGNGNIHPSKLVEN